MKRNITFFFAFVFSFCLFSCGGIPIMQSAPHNNETYTVDYLFEHDGCKVYRFYDHGSYVYFTNCNGNVTSIDSDSTRTITITRSQR